MLNSRVIKGIFYFANLRILDAGRFKEETRHCKGMLLLEKGQDTVKECSYFSVCALSAMSTQEKSLSCCHSKYVDKGSQFNG